MGLVALNIASGAVFTPQVPAKPGYDIKVNKAPAAGAPKDQPKPEIQPIEPLLSSADVGRGQSSAQKCAGCHTFDKGGRALVGPNLYGVVGRKKASVASFNYTPAFKGMTGDWTIDDLNGFLTSPKGMVPGTAMQFDGVTAARGAS